MSKKIDIAVVRFFVVVELPASYDDMDHSELATWFAGAIGEEEPEVDVTVYGALADLVADEEESNGTVRG